ncbi:MAG: acyltransferase domain-containing protein, partial [Myxococcales bacterium]|nr:acyltransferase domain-containing protein [Myxococcales bacterium]
MVDSGPTAGVVFVCPGHGSQWPGMGRALLDESPAFADAIDACDAALAPLTGWSVRAVLAGADDAPPLDRIDVVQPALFAMSLGLAAVWRSLGVEPAAVVGHSVGEIAAAVIAGALSLEDGARVVASRGRLIAGIKRRGAMLATGLPADALAARLEGAPLTVPVVNGPASAVASGDADAIAALEAELSAEGVFCRRVAIGFAAHSAHMEGILDAFVDAIDGIRPRASTVPLYSGVSGGRLDGAALGAGYWRRNVRDEVRFDRAVRALTGDGHDLFVELGGHPTLAGAFDAGVVTASLRRDAGLEAIHRALGALHIAGHAIDWRRVMGSGPVAPLPTYAFQRQRYWLVPTPRIDAPGAGLRPVAHPLLEAAVVDAETDAVLFTGRLSSTAPSWMADHRVFGAAVLPGTGLLDLALAAGRAVGCPRVVELTLQDALAVPDTGAVALQVRVGEPESDGRRAVGVFGRRDDDAAWTTHARGIIDQGMRSVAAMPWPPAGAPLDLDGHYDRLADLRLAYGAAFRNLRAAWRADDGVYAEVALPEALEAAGYGLHPALLDAALHALALDGIDAARLPFAWADVTLFAVEARAMRCHLRPGADADAPIEVRAFDAAGEPVLAGWLSTRPAAPM